jgi:hypothetical protein
VSRIVATLAAIAAVVGAVQLAAAEPAGAVPGLGRVIEGTPSDNRPTKTAVASCPGKDVVVGGGAVVRDGGRNVVRLIESRPFRERLIFDYYHWFAKAEAPDLGRDFNWSVTAYAICANRSSLADYEITEAFTHNGTSETFDQVDARCPSGTVAYGAGAEVIGLDVLGGGGPNGIPTGQLGLQMVRTSGPLDIARAAARESAAGFAGQWRLKAYAICAHKILFGPGNLNSGVHAVGNSSFTATAETLCPDGFRTHGPGGGGGLTDGGPSWLRAIYPHNGLGGITVGMTAPLLPSIGGMVAYQTCARF